MMHFTSRNPAVSAVIATNGKRPELLRVAVRSILEQSYRGFVEVVVVFDRVEPDRLEDIEVGENRALKIVSNTRSGGLAGGRNSGIIASSGEMIGFCDDDDYWMPSEQKFSGEIEENEMTADRARAEGLVPAKD